MRMSKVGIMGLLRVGKSKLLEPLASEGQEFRDSGQVPIGVADFDVTQVGREAVNHPVNVETLVVPGEQTITGKCMPHVVEAWTDTANRGRRWQSLPQQAVEGVPHCSVG